MGPGHVRVLSRQDGMGTEATLIRADAARTVVERLNMLAREGCLSYVLAAHNARPYEWNDEVVEDLLDLASPPCAVPIFALEWRSGEVCAKMRCSYQDGVGGTTQRGWVRVVVDPVPLCDAKTHERSYVLAVQEPHRGTTDELNWELRNPLCPHARVFFNTQCAT